MTYAPTPINSSGLMSRNNDMLQPTSLASKTNAPLILSEGRLGEQICCHEKMRRAEQLYAMSLLNRIQPATEVALGDTRLWIQQYC